MNEALCFTKEVKQIFHNFPADKNNLVTVLCIKMMSLHGNIYPHLSASVKDLLWYSAIWLCLSEAGGRWVFANLTDTEKQSFHAAYMFWQELVINN